MAAPTRVGKYEIAEQVGVGGFGVVYKAWDPFIQRWVALKTCNATDDEMKQRFYREAQLAGALQHPNITLIYDFGIEEGVPFFVQEFLSGTDLDELFEKRRLSLEAVLAILLQVCAGLDYAHSRGIVHRDIKPANVRVLEDGTVKIMDFGIAKSLETESRLTQTGVALGTAGYLAPEQLSGKPVDARTDLFSLGVMVYELITAVRPFAGPNLSNVIYQILNQEPVRPRQRNPRCPERLEKAILKALAKDPAARFATVREFAQELKDIQASLSDRTARRGIETTTAIVREELERLSKEGSFELTSPTQLAARPLEQIPTESVRDEHETKGHRWWAWIAGGFVATAGAFGVWWLAFAPMNPPAASTLAQVPPPQPAATAAPPAPTTAPTPVPTASPVEVELFVDPVSEIEVDGRSLGKVQAQKLSLATGPHRIRQRILDYTEKLYEVDVKSGMAPVRLHLPPFGILSVINDLGVPLNGAQVYLDGEMLGALSKREWKVQAGAHDFKVLWPDGSVYQERLTIPGEKVTQRIVRPQ